jgi:hypothetical protein
VLIDALAELGFHQQDIGDAFYEADPDWLDRPLDGEAQSSCWRTFSEPADDRFDSRRGTRPSGPLLSRP